MYFYYVRTLQPTHLVALGTLFKNILLNFGDLVDMRAMAGYVIRNKIISIIDIFNVREVKSNECKERP